MKGIVLLILFYWVAASTFIPVVPQLYARSTQNISRLSSMFILTELTPNQFYLMSQTIVVNPLVDLYVASGPKEDVQHHETTDLCQHVKPFLRTYYNTTWKSGNFCESVFCQENSTHISFNTTLQRNSFFSYCHYCEETLPEKNFINLVQNGSCKLSNQVLSKYEKCGKFMKFKDMFPYPNEYLDLCYSLGTNTFFSKNNFENIVLPRFAKYGSFIYTSIFNILVLIPIIFITVIPEIADIIHVVFIKKSYKNLIRYVFSIRHQIIVLSLLSLLTPCITLIIFASQLDILFFDIAGKMSFSLVSIAFFQLIILWAHICAQSETLKTNLSKKLIAISVLASMFPVSITIITIIQLGIVFILGSFFPELIVYMLLLLAGAFFSYVGFLYVVMIVIIILLWVFSIRMMKQLSKASPGDDVVSKALYFSKLKFTRLTLISSFIFFASIAFLTVGLMNFIFPGVLGWYIYIIIPAFWALTPSITATILLFGLTNTNSFRKTYSCACCKKKKKIQE